MNLQGAPWSPHKTNKSITLANYFATAAASLVVFGAVHLSPYMEKNKLIHLCEGMAGSAVALYLCTNRRKSEAKKISAYSDRLVIDKQPDNTTPPTSSKILANVVNLHDQYNKGSFFSLAGIKGAAFYFSICSINTYNMMNRPAEIFIFSQPFWASYMFVHAVDVLSRYNQLGKVSNLKWVVTDQGDAIKTFQKQEAEKLATAKGIAIVPISPR